MTLLSSPADVGCALPAPRGSRWSRPASATPARTCARCCGEPRSARLAARLLADAGVERLVALQLHSPALESALHMPLVHLAPDGADRLGSSAPGFLLDLGHRLSGRRAPLTARSVTPSALPRRWPSSRSPALGPVVAVAVGVLGDVRGSCACLIVDDTASTGGTIAGAARALLDAGARGGQRALCRMLSWRRARSTRICASSVGRIVTTQRAGEVRTRRSRSCSGRAICSPGRCTFSRRPHDVCGRRPPAADTAAAAQPPIPAVDGWRHDPTRSRSAEHLSTGGVCVCASTPCVILPGSSVASSPRP